MDTFIQRFQPTQYIKWREGCEVGCHPEDNLIMATAPKPKLKDIFVNKK